MGGWKMEVAKMAMYLSFPITMFYYFNRPELYEEYVIKARREFYPPDSKTCDKEIQEFIKDTRQKEHLKMIKALEEAEKK